MEQLTPRQIVAALDKYIVGQADAKRAVAVAVRNRWRRQRVPEGMRQDVSPKNILMIGPTGVGKTEIARRLAGLTGAPFIKVEATKYTEVGYHGRDVESMIRDLLDTSIALVRDEMTESVKEPAGRQVEERLLDYLLPGTGRAEPAASLDEADGDETDDARHKHARTREKLREQLRAGALEDRTIEIAVEDRASVVGVLGQAGMEMDVEFQSMFEKMLPTQRQTRRLSVAEARKVLLAQEAEKLIDKAKIHAEAIARVEQSGIVFLDEIDKVATSEGKSGGGGGGGGGGGPDVSRQGVQRDLLPIVEGSTVVTKYGPVRTDHILFIAAGAFHVSRPADLMPELQGRFPIRVELSDLTKEDFVRILREPRNALTKQTVALLATEGVRVEWTDDAVEAMAQLAFDVNRRDQNIGARRLYTILEKVLEEVSFDAPEMAGQSVIIDAAYVRRRLADVVKDEDLSRFIL
ncbi:MAG TPA: ATP-dependent protease ATPase subunit HslU [Tepidisphaeraceae bacterium]|nr:ATP-dependent protease ATPase subunit HslU [Tepidisphaeraceae bacterium]